MASLQLGIGKVGHVAPHMASEDQELSAILLNLLFVTAHPKLPNLPREQLGQITANAARLWVTKTIFDL